MTIPARFENFASKWTCASLIAVLIGACASPAMAEDNENEALMEKAEQLEEKARDMKMEGQHDRAKQLMREARELRKSAGGEEPKAGAPRDLGLEKERKAAIAEQKRLRREASEPGPRKMKKRMLEMDGESPQPAPRWAHEGNVRPQMPAGRPAELGRRVRHLEVAIENLRAAGLDEPAERLSQVADEMRRQITVELPQTGPRRPMGAPNELEQFRGELNEMRRMIRELNARLDELSRQRR